MSESITVRSSEVLDPVEREAVQSIVREASLMPMTPWQRRLLAFQLQRKRGQLILQLADVERHAVLCEAIVMAEGRREQAREHAALATFKTRLACLHEAGRERDASLVAVNNLSDESAPMMRRAVDLVTAAYVEGMTVRMQQD